MKALGLMYLWPSKLGDKSTKSGNSNEQEANVSDRNIVDVLSIDRSSDWSECSENY